MHDSECARRGLFGEPLKMTRKIPDFLKAALFKWINLEEISSLTSEPSILSWTAYEWYFDKLIFSLANLSA